MTTIDNDVFEEEKVVQCLTTKEIKALARPEFRANPDKFYPTELLRKMEFERYLCTKCDGYFWMHDTVSEDLKATPVCGDSNCIGEYTFINRGTGKGHVDRRPEDFHYSYSDAWQEFAEAMQTSRIKVTPIDKYPTVARWRPDVDFVAAGIFCFQPYCVTGELDAPENPLCCPQFCVRFNDLDNIGLTGRHYSGFVMLGIQVFNLPDKFIFFKEDCVEFNLRWLTDFLKIPKNEIFIREDVWAGGGNLGACMEYFIGGLELGNMVFMQYKTYPDGSREELKVKVIDVGIGLERVPWLINGTPTSYYDVFEGALAHINDKLKLDVMNEVWTKFGPLSSQLDIDECPDIEKTWNDIATMCGSDVATVKKSIQPIKDLYIILDHTRSALMLITDGALPSSKGGGYNIRNILRRTFEKLMSNKIGERTWFDIIGGVEGLMELFEAHKKDMTKLYGYFKDYSSFQNIIEIEFQRYVSSDSMHDEKLKKMLKKKNNQLTIDDWILCMKTYGIPADKIAAISKLDIPNNLYYEIAIREEKVARVMETQLYDTSEYKPTDMLYLTQPDAHEFDATIVGTLNNLTKPEPYPRDIVILDRTGFYPTSGGQKCDKGQLRIGGEVYEVVNIEKVGACAIHVLDRALPEAVDAGAQVTGNVDTPHRNQLKAHHTATHIIFASCRQVLGPHCWQHGANKTEQYAHIDITHYEGISYEQEREIENRANQIVNSNGKITKTFHYKKDAELKWGMDLYQGGAIPSTNIRVVEIAGVDTEACCGTHCDNTGEVGIIRILKTSRISDGIVRLYYVSWNKALERLNYESDLLRNICDVYSVSYGDLVSTATRIFKDMKTYGDKCDKQDKKILNLTVNLCYSTDATVLVVKSDLPNATLFFKFLKAHAKKLQDNKKGIIFYNNNFVYGLLGNKDMLDLQELCTLLKVEYKEVKQSNKIDFKDKDKKIDFKVKDVLEFGIIMTKKNTEFEYLKTYEPTLIQYFNEKRFSICDE